MTTKNAILLVLAACLLPIGLTAQSTQQDSLAFAKLQQDYAVPDAPAFTILGNTPTTILRPTTVRAVAVAASDFLGNNAQLTLPANFAMELSPALLIAGSGLNLQDYQASPWLYRLRLSVGTSRPVSGSDASELGLGLRITIIDGADLRTNEQYISSVTAISRQINTIVANAAQNPALNAGISLSAADQRTIDSLKNVVNMEIAQDSLWNENTLEVAFAARGSSPDTLVKDLTLDKLEAWLSFGYGFGSWGQLFIGANAVSAKASPTADFETSINAALRFYAGTNYYKGYVETHYTGEENNELLSITGGSEIRLYSDLWLEFSAGAQYADANQTTNLVSNFNVKFGLMK